MKTDNGLIIMRIEQRNGGFSVRLDEPQGDIHASITFDDERDQWTWKGNYSTHLVEVIRRADEAFAKSKRETEAKRQRQEEDRRKRDDRLNIYWERVVDVYGGNDKN